MHTSCAMIALRVTPLTEDEGVEVDGAVEAEGVTVSVQGRLSQSCVSLRLIVVASMALKTMK